MADRKKALEKLDALKTKLTFLSPGTWIWPAHKTRASALRKSLRDGHIEDFAITTAAKTTNIDDDEEKDEEKIKELIYNVKYTGNDFEVMSVLEKWPIQEKIDQKSELVCFIFF